MPNLGTSTMIALACTLMTRASATMGSLSRKKTRVCSCADDRPARAAFVWRSFMLLTMASNSSLSFSTSGSFIKLRDAAKHRCTRTSAYLHSSICGSHCANTAP